MKEVKAGIAAQPPSGSFLFSKEATAALREKISVREIQDILERTIRLEQYGAIRRLLFLAIARPPEDIWDQHLLYSVDEQEISIQIGVDISLIEQAPGADAVTGLLARYFLAAIPLFAEVPVPAFSISTFRRDVEDLFRRQGWLANPLPELDRSAIAMVWGTSFQSGRPANQPASFFVRKIARREWFDAIDSAAFAARLNEQVDLATYGDGVHEIYLTLLADDREEDLAEVGVAYFRPERELHLSVPLGSPPYGLAELGRAFQWGLSAGSRVAEVDDFDVEGLAKRLGENLLY